MKMRYVVICIMVITALLLVFGFVTKPELFHIRLVSKEVRTVVVTDDLRKALDHYYDEWGRFPTTEDEVELLTILRKANYLKDSGSLRAGEFTYEPINRGQTYNLK